MNTQTDHVFGAPTSSTPATPQDVSSPLAALVGEFAGRVAEVTSVRYALPGMPDWWIEFDGARVLPSKMQRLARGGDADVLDAAYLILAMACTAIGKGEQEVFGLQSRGPEQLGPFRSGAIEEALGGQLQVRPGEKPWRAAIRWALGASSDWHVIAWANRVQSSLNVEIEQVGANPTD